MTNEQIAKTIRSIRSELHTCCKITTREAALEKLDQLADDITAPEREVPQEAEIITPIDGYPYLVVRDRAGHGKDYIMVQFTKAATPADRRMYEMARRSYEDEKHILKLVGIESNVIITPKSQFYECLRKRIDYIETGKGE